MGMLFILFVSGIVRQQLHAQPIADSSASSPDSALAITYLLPEPVPFSATELFLPEFLRAGYRTRTWVRDSLAMMNGPIGDIDLVDMIYVRALHEAQGDKGIALLAALFATFEHRTVPFTFGLNMPLTLESEGAFNARVAKLPYRLFLDMPDGDDRDKLQHFFASAWLAWGLDNGQVADVIGNGIEIGEDLFVEGGADDPRDVRANRLGQHFAALLRDYPTMLPGELFRGWNREYLRRMGTAIPNE